MSLHTTIEWCDSTVNPVMGCDGCELWDPRRDVRICYAGQLHEMRAGRPGYADDFLVPKLFPGRMAAAARWRDLTGQPRPDKPWLDGLPRLVFISDMGDALSASVSFEFLRDEVIRVVADWRHIGIWLTKQPQRMAAFADWLHDGGIAWPENLWAGTSITGPGQGARVRHLRFVPAAVRFLSIEPVLHDPGELNLDGIKLVIVGGESGPGAKTTHVEDLRGLVARARAAGCAPFVKQLGASPSSMLPAPIGISSDWCELPHAYVWRLRDRKGGDWSEWPRDLRVREFPR